MTAQRHVIMRQSLEIELPRGADGLAYHRVLSGICQRRITPVISEACDRASPAERLYRIPRLELDLGKLDPGRLETDLSSRLAQRLRPALEAAKTRLDAEQSTDGLNPAVRSALELFALFARSGILPWWVDGADRNLLQNQFRMLLEKAPQALADQARDLFRDATAARRVARTYPADYSLKLATLLFGNANGVAGAISAHEMDRLSKAASEVLDGLASGLHHSLARREVAVREALLLAAAQEASRGAPSGFLLNLLANLARASGHGVRDILAKIEERLQADGQAPRLGRILRELRQNPAVPAEPIPTSKPEAPTHCETITTNAADPVSIGNAGLCLLWPFFPTLFQRLELTMEDRFCDEPARHRAVVLLQFLVSEAPDPPEFQLPLNKILCGMEPKTLLEFCDPLTAREREECANCIAAALAHAEALGNWSVAGFRTAFLRRNGQLSARDGAWLLRVETDARDTPLCRLPWSLCWIKLPWMHIPLQVEW